MNAGGGGTETPLKTWVKEKLTYTDLNAEFTNIYLKLRGKVVATGDTMTGNLVLDDCDLKVYDGQGVITYSDNGSTMQTRLDENGLELYY